MKQKYVFVGAGAKGGSGKTASHVAMADVLSRVGYSVRFVDADASNRTLSGIYPDETASGKLIQINLDVDGEFQKTLESCAAMEEDIVIIDMPGSQTAFYVDFFTHRSPEDFEKIGIKLVIGVTIANTAAAQKGIRDVLRIFGKAYPVIALKTNMANLRKTEFRLEDSKTGAALLAFAKGRFIEIPQMAPLQRQEYDRLSAPPSQFLLGERAATKLGLTHLSAMEWDIFGNKMIDSVLPHAEWLTGKPIPNPPEKVKPKLDDADAAMLDAMAEDDL